MANKTTYNAEGSLTFTYRRDSTPLIVFASQGGYAGSILKFYGNLREMDSNRYWVRIGGAVAGGGVGGALCAMDAVSQPTGSPVDRGVLICRLGEKNATSEAGRYAVTFETRDVELASQAHGVARHFSHPTPRRTSACCPPRPQSQASAVRPLTLSASA